MSGGPAVSEKVAIVTGAGSGIGAATARCLVNSGHAVVGIDLRWNEQIEGVAAIEGSVAEPGTWERSLEQAARLGGAPGKLVLGAGYLSVGALLEIDDEEFRRVFEVNVFAAALGLRSCLPAMVRAGTGAVVAVASIDAVSVEQGLAAYCASKGALLQLIKAVAVDYALDGIRANCVCPGAVDTPFFQRHVDAAPDREQFLAEKTGRHPTGRLLDPQEIANVIEFLLDPRSSGMTGATVLVDHGLTTPFAFRPPTDREPVRE
jgi:2-keto-3-deoxy-L-fuconate dehydrogenase